MVLVIASSSGCSEIFTKAFKSSIERKVLSVSLSPALFAQLALYQSAFRHQATRRMGRWIDIVVQYGSLSLVSLSKTLPFRFRNSVTAI